MVHIVILNSRVLLGPLHNFGWHSVGFAREVPSAASMGRGL